MIKKLNYYKGCTILGYRLSIPKLDSTFYARNIKNIGSLRAGNNNNLYCLKKVKRTFNK